MRKAGFKVRIDTMDWGTLSQRRNNKGPVDPQKDANRGGGNLFVTVATALNAGHRTPIPTSRPRAPTTSRDYIEASLFQGSQLWGCKTVP